MNLASTIGLLVTAQHSLSRRGRSQDAADLGSAISALLDADLDNPSVVLDDSDPAASLAVAYDLSEHPTDSLAVRTAAASDRRLSKGQWRQLRRRMRLHPPRRKRWICCSKPEKRTTRKGKKVWGSVCKYRILSGPQKDSTMAMWIVRSKDPAKRPHGPMTFNGSPRRVPTCRAGQ